jgi:hypothetical protein
MIEAARFSEAGWDILIATYFSRHRLHNHSSVDQRTASQDRGCSGQNRRW